MDIYCLEDFKVEFEKLKSKKAYRTIEADIISYFFGKTCGDLCSGTRLNNSNDIPYIKKRIRGSGGFRCYFLLIVKKENLYLMFIHPKTGPMGSDNITDESKAYLYKKILDCIENNDLYQLSLSKDGKEIIFNRY